ncbi:hypothetical protein F2Q69_00055797 [Brassica cretica]|uniref:Uncharacterized protein n=1 Tax=Brassica cretica TaxID=69181 RepID=A0A8S9N7V5_BRACR|nr:hypothetical protein F2Q69_00055797 [Brassica cretica]
MVRAQHLVGEAVLRVWEAGPSHAHVHSRRSEGKQMCATERELVYRRRTESGGNGGGGRRRVEASESCSSHENRIGDFNVLVSVAAPN